LPFFDPNRFEFAMNDFQVYDIALATNENTITLRVADRAGNVTEANCEPAGIMAPRISRWARWPAPTD
jgi:hypothetical protein